MGLQRSKLKEMGLADDVIESVMAAYGSQINAFKADLETSEQEKAKLKSELESTKAHVQELEEKAKTFNVKDTDEYKELYGRFSAMENKEKLKNAGVNEKYQDIVKSKVDFENFDNSVNAIKEKYPEFFVNQNMENATTTNENAVKKPVFSTGSQNPTENKTPEDIAYEELKKVFTR